VGGCFGRWVEVEWIFEWLSVGGWWLDGCANVCVDTLFLVGCMEVSEGGCWLWRCVVRWVVVGRMCG